MPGAVISAVWQEDGSATVYGRLMSRDGSGEAIAGEGKCLTKIDISSITFSVFDSSAPTPAVNTGIVDKNASVFDTLQTTLDDPAWKFRKGFNFRHDLGPENFPVGGKVYVVEYRIVTSGGAVGWAVYKGSANSVFTS